MNNIPSHLKYTDSHEWSELLDDGTVRIGITDHAQDSLGDMVFVELPEMGREVAAAEECAVVESVKAASDLYSPIAGEIMAVNTQLEDSPELINQSAFQDGWIFLIKPKDVSELDKLLDANAYADLVRVS
ncbi:Glycine cleavage system H protein [hydrothermal vent metagenome]|uniref:Glycine cleavage system H protein n=1 Tax=hydrothermal vent metagenome TaxID=652676 RepID=A0A3B0ZST4_9ZZZZ